MNPANKNMPKNTRLDHQEAPESPVENPPKDWVEEDIELDNRKPNLSELEDDTSEL